MSIVSIDEFHKVTKAMKKHSKLLSKKILRRLTRKEVIK